MSRGARFSDQSVFLNKDDAGANQMADTNEPDQIDSEIAQWRKLRNEARALAIQTADFEARDALMRIAGEYNRLAKRAEEKLADRAKPE